MQLCMSVLCYTLNSQIVRVGDSGLHQVGEQVSNSWKTLQDRLSTRSDLNFRGPIREFKPGFQRSVVSTETGDQWSPRRIPKRRVGNEILVKEEKKQNFVPKREDTDKEIPRKQIEEKVQLLRNPVKLFERLIPRTIPKRRPT